METEVETETLNIDEKGRITIPASMRQKIKAKAFVAVLRNGIVHIVPKISLRELEGRAPKVTTEDLRDKSDRII